MNSSMSLLQGPVVTFADWHGELARQATLLGWDVSDREAWRDLFDEGLSPAQALARDAAEAV